MNPVDFMTLGRIVSDQRRCFEYFLQQLPAYSCPFCQSPDQYIMSRQRVRCKQCRKDTQPLAGTKFSLLNIPCSTWLIILKLFELSISARKAAKEAGFSYKTTLKGYDILRHVITEELAKSDDLLKGEKEFFENRDTPKGSSGSIQSGPGTPLPYLATAGSFSKE